MVSVIVIGKNEGARLSACLESVREALGPLSHELIYVDSRSEDDSLAVARDCGARCFLLEEPRTTAGLGRLVGAKEARGDTLLFLDGDMRLCPGFVERALTAVSLGGWDGATGQREDVFLLDGRIVARQENVFGCTAERPAPEFGGALFIRAETLARCGGWAADTVACEEAELHARLLEVGARIVELPVPMIVHEDAVRESRGVLGVILSRRRLGEGQALICALKSGHARAYIRRERRKFLFFALDALSLLSLCFGAYGLLLFCFLQAAQLGYLAAKRNLRAFISQKLFFPAFLLGLFTYRRRSRAYAAA